MLSLLQWLTILYCIPTILCRRFRLTCSNDLDSLYFGMCVAFFYFIFILSIWQWSFIFVFVPVFVQPSVWIARSATGALNTKKSVGIKKGKCPASGFLCMFLQPITNVTFQIALDSCTSNKKVEKKKAGFCVLIHFCLLYSIFSEVFTTTNVFY